MTSGEIMNSNSTLVAKTGLALAMLLLGACAGEPTLTERNFGDSVRQMVRAQTAHPETLTAPSNDPVTSADGQILEAVLEVYRTDVAKPASVGDEIVINVGGGQR
jgi:hypothetical protein